MLRFLSDFTATWSAGQRLFSFTVLLVSCCVLPLLLGFGDQPTRIGGLLVSSMLLWLGASLALPADESRNKLRRYSLRVGRGLTIALIGLAAGSQVRSLEVVQ